MKHVLSIAGSDPGGGAGIQADLKVLSAHGVYGMAIITALTVQNTCGVRSALPVPPDFIAEQFKAVAEDIRIDAIKLGMLGGEAAIARVAALLHDYLQERRSVPVVLDPVMVAKGGHRLLDAGAERVLLRSLLPLATLVTPNLAEASVLAGMPVENLEDMRRAACVLREEFGAKAVLVKGGHLAAEPCDLLVDGMGEYLLSGPRIDARHTHGTGCSLSSAIAARLARGHSLREAVRLSRDYIRAGIAEGLAVGGGIGPIHHFHEFFDPAGQKRPDQNLSTSAISMKGEYQHEFV